MTRRILSAWLPGWQIRRLQREGWPADRPLVTVETQRGQRRVAETCEMAASSGVMSGHSLAQARALCPTLVVAEADPMADLAALDRLAAWCERVSPLTASDAPDGLWIDITGCAHLMGGESALARALAARLAPMSLGPMRVAIAGTPGAAWALARDVTGPEIRVLTEGEERRALASLPVGLLRLDPILVGNLRQMGLRRIGELARQTRADLALRFGAASGLRLDQAYGAMPEAIAWPRPPTPWSERTAFAEPIGTAEDFARTLGLLADRLCTRLEAAGLGALHVSAVFHRVDELRPEIAIATASPLRDPVRMTRLLRAKIETVDPGFGVEAVVLEAETVAPLALRQDEMGTRTPRSNRTSEELTAVIDDLSNRLTPDRLWRPAPQESHVPERAATIAPPLAPSVSWPYPPGERPLRLLRPPEPIQATAPVPDDPPIQFRWRGALHRVRAASGPERIGAEWWRRSAQDERFRDYYRVEDQQGARFWLFRIDLPNAPSWFLHGLFG